MPTEPDAAPGDSSAEWWTLEPWNSLDAFRGHMQKEFRAFETDTPDLLADLTAMIERQRGWWQESFPWLDFADPCTLAIFGAALTISMTTSLHCNRACTVPDHVDYHALVAFTRVGLVYRDLCQRAAIRDPQPTGAA